MSNRDIVERALVCFADPPRRERYFDVYSENVILHGYSGVEPGLDSVRKYYAGVWSVFPDARVIAEDLIETDDKVILRFAMVGTHTQPFLGIEATGRSVRIPGMTILRFEDQKCVERWSVTDSLSLLAQLGAFPVDDRRGSGFGGLRCPLYGEQGGGRGVALGIPWACAEPVQYAELVIYAELGRSDCELLLRSQNPDWRLVAYVEIDLLRVREDCFFRICDVNQLFVHGRPDCRPLQTSKPLSGC